MKRYSVAQARQQFAELLDPAERGDAVVIERRGVRFVVEAQQGRRRVPCGGSRSSSIPRARAGQGTAFSVIPTRLDLVAALLHRDWVNAKAGGVRKGTEGVEVMACTGLVLQGGGALGAFEYGALLRLYEEPAFNPDIISGVSIGAINAACLVGAKDDPVKTLQFVWDRFTVQAPWLVPPQGQRFLALFGNPNFFNMRYDYLAGAFWTSFYRTDPLRRLLHETIDFDKLNNSSINLVISATNVRTGDIEIFDNRTTRITAEHIIASGSLPPGFPMTAIEGEWYWDGGLFNNTPLSPVIERLDPSPDVKRHLYVIDLFPNAGKVPSNMLDVMDRMFELIFSNKLVKNVEMTRRVDEFIQALDEIEANLPPEARERVTKLPGYQRLRQYKIIKNLVVIANEEPELVFGPFDFSQQTIKKRIEAGYQAAARRLARGEEPGAPMEPGSAGDRAAGTGKRRRKRRDERIDGFSNLLRERLRTDRN